jgi:hypothetical protein
MRCATLAFPLSLIKRQIRFTAARRTRFGRRIEPIDRQQLAPIPAALIFQHRPKPPPTLFRNDSGEVAILHHTSDTQIFDCNRLVLTNESGAEFMQEIFARIYDTLVAAGDLAPCFFTVLRT